MLSFGSSSKLTQVAYNKASCISKKLSETKMQIWKSLSSVGYICNLYRTEQKGKRSVKGVFPERKKQSLLMSRQAMV